jgi:hypothetical protein
MPIALRSIRRGDSLEMKRLSAIDGGFVPIAVRVLRSLQALKVRQIVF